MSELYQSLRSLVSGSGDPVIVRYAAEHILEGVPPQSKYYAKFVQYRNDLVSTLFEVHFNPKRGLGFRPRNPLEAKFALQKQAQLVLEHQQAMQRALQEAEFRAYMQKQFEEMVKEQAKQNELIHKLLRQLVKEDDVVVVNKLIDPEPMQRWIAVLVSDRKRLQVEDKLIDLLDDPHPAVREAAHHALVRLGRSTDFGPPAKAKAKDIAAAQKSWREWHQLQVDTRFADDESPPTLTKPR
jgi:hypothetical protein